METTMGKEFEASAFNSFTLPNDIEGIDINKEPDVMELENKNRIKEYIEKRKHELICDDVKSQLAMIRMEKHQ